MFMALFICGRSLSYFFTINCSWKDSRLVFLNSLDIMLTTKEINFVLPRKKSTAMIDLIILNIFRNYMTTAIV